MKESILIICAVSQLVCIFNSASAFLAKTDKYECTRPDIFQTGRKTLSQPAHVSCLAQEIKVYGNRLFSLQSMFTYNFNDLNLCEDPDAKSDSPSLSFGQILSGERWMDTLYNLTVPRNSTNVVCANLCTKNYKGEKLDSLKMAVNTEYFQNLIFGNVQALICDPSREICSTSIPIGCYVTKDMEKKGYCVTSHHFNQPDTYYLFNHLEFEITFEMAKEGGVGRILVVIVQPKSRSKCGDSTKPFGIKGSDTNVTVSYTYSFKFVFVDSAKSGKKITDKTLREDRVTSVVNIMMFNALNSAIVVLFLSPILAGVIAKIFCKDAWLTKKCQSIDIRCRKSFSSMPEYTNGMKFIHGDVFRPPRFGLLLCSLVGNGVQLLGVALITLVCASFGLTQPYNGVRGQLLTIIIYSWTGFAFVNGYVTARMYKMFNGKLWKDTLKITIITALVFPGIIFSIFLVLNTIHSFNKSAAALSLKTVLSEAGLWIAISLPLAFLGSVTGNNFKVIENPVPTNPSCRSIPRKSCFNNPVVSFLLSGFLPYGCIFIQSFFVMNAIWNLETYGTYGYLLLIFLLYIITVIEVSVLQCNFQLHNEDYRWWWRSWINSTSAGVYLFIYSINYYFRKCMFSGVTSSVIFFGYTAVMAFLLALLTGAVAFLSCFIFVRKVYSTIEIDMDEELEIEDLKENEKLQQDQNL